MKPWVKCSPERAGRGKYVKPFWFRSLRQSSGTGACLFFQIKIERNFYIDLYSLSFLQFSIRGAERLVSDSVSEIRVLSSVKVVCDIMEDEGASWLINRIAAHVDLTRIFHHLSPNYTVRTIVVYPKSTQVFCTLPFFPLHCVEPFSAAFLVRQFDLYLDRCRPKWPLKTPLDNWSGHIYANSEKNNSYDYDQLIMYILYKYIIMIWYIPY